MPKGKKFTAAEKHFLDKENRYKKEIKQLETTLTELHSTIENLKTENAKLNEELIKTTAERDEAIKLSNLDADELQKHIKSTKNAAQLYGIIASMNQFMG